jgi:L-asparagine transporter-like permease
MRAAVCCVLCAVCLHVALVLFIIVVGFVKSNPANAQPFLPYGPAGICNGASIVFFAYIGECVGTAAAGAVRCNGVCMRLAVTVVLQHVLWQ